MQDFWQRSDVQIMVDPATAHRSTTEVQQAIRFNLFHVLQASARADTTGVPAKGPDGKPMRGIIFGTRKFTSCPFWSIPLRLSQKICSGSAMVFWTWRANERGS